MYKKDSTIVEKTLSFLDKSQKLQGIKLIFLMLLSTIAELFGLSLLIVVLGYLLGTNSEITSNLPVESFISFLGLGNDQLIVGFLIIFSVIFSIKLLLLITTSWVESRYIATFKKKLSDNLFSNFLNRETSSLLKKNSSEYFRNFTTEIDWTSRFFSCAIKVILDLIIVIALFGFLLFFDPITSASVLLTLSILTVVYYFSIKDILLKWGKKGLYNRQKRLQFVSEGFAAIKYIKILAKEKFFFDKFSLQNTILADLSFKINFAQSLPKHILEYFLFITILVLLLILFQKNYSYSEIITILSVYTITAFRMIPSVNRIWGNTQAMRVSYPSLDRIFLESQTPVKKKKEKLENFTFKREIKIDIKSFFYKNKRKFNLKNILIKLKKNSKLGIIGPSGSGKSTLIDIICGFIKSNKGDVYIDGQSISNNLEGWQKNIGYIPQKVVILENTLRENILFGLNKKKISDKKIIEIIKKVNLYKFFKKLPHGLNEVIKQEGLNVSGGEMQRIGIARALMNNPEIIILDEATSALDSFTENNILKEINLLNKTIIFVSHRINSLKFCDKVYNIKDNSVKNFSEISRILKI